LTGIKAEREKDVTIEDGNELLSIFVNIYSTRMSRGKLRTIEQKSGLHMVNK